jgi:hypothetical protein
MNMGNLAYRLKLSSQLYIHPIFHISLLESYHENRLSDRTQISISPMEMEGELEFEIQEILDSKINRGKLRYLMKWKGYGPDERSWESVGNR